MIDVANKKFTSIKHDYRLIFKMHSAFTEVTSELATPSLSKTPVSTKATKPTSIALNLTSIDDILAGNSTFTVDVVGFCTTDEVRRESMVVNHSSKDGPKLKEDIKGRMQFLMSEKDPTMIQLGTKARELQINMWGEELCGL